MNAAGAAFATALVALVGAGAHFAGAPGAAFGLFALLTIAGGLICLFERSGVRSAYALFSTVLGTAGLFLLLGSDFLAMTQVLVGVGGILALLLFSAMLAPPDPRERSRLRIGAALCFLVPLAAWVALRCADVDAFARVEIGKQAPGDAEHIAVALLDPARYAVPFEVAAVLLCVALVAAACFARRTTREESK